MKMFSWLLSKICGKEISFRDALALFGRYGTIGAIGVGLQTLLLYMFIELAGVWYVASLVLATLGKRIFTYIYHKNWTFRAKEHKATFAAGGAYFIFATTIMGLNGGLIYVLVDWFNMNLYVAYSLLVPTLGMLSFVGTRHIVSRPFIRHPC